MNNKYNKRLSGKKLTCNGKVNADIMHNGQIIKMRDRSIPDMLRTLSALNKKFK